MKPEYLRISDIEKERLKKEKDIILSQMQKQHPKKNQKILDKISEGKMNKLFQEIVLVKQNFVKEKNKSIENLLQENGCDIIDMYRFEVSQD